MGATPAQRVRLVMMIALVMSEDWRKHFQHWQRLIWIVRIQQLRGVLNQEILPRIPQSKHSGLDDIQQTHKMCQLSQVEPVRLKEYVFTSDCFFCPSCNHSAVYNHYQHQHDQDQTFETFRRPIPDPNMVVVTVVALDLHRRLVHLIRNWWL